MSAAAPSRLCFVLEAYLPVMNGASVHLGRLVPLLARRGAEVTVISRRAFPDDPPVERTADAFIVRVGPCAGLRRRAKFLMLPGVFWALLRHARRYDVIVVCDLKVLGLVALVAAALTGKRCYLRAESCGEVDGNYMMKYRAEVPTGLRRAVFNAVIRARNGALRRADGFICICSAIEAEFRRCGFPASRLVRTTNGVDAGYYSPPEPDQRRELRRRLEIADDETVFLYTGRISIGKGLEHLVEAWDGFARQRKGRLFIVGGEAGFSNNLQSRLVSYVAEHGMTGSVVFTGNVPGVREYLHAADVFLLPSQSEATSLSLLEAMACGLPSIVTGVDGNPDLVQDGVNGILVPYADPPALLRSMLALADDPERRRRMGAQARAFVREHNDAGRIAETYVRLAARTG